MRKTTRTVVATIATALSIGVVAGLAGTSAAYQDVTHARTAAIAADVSAPFQPGLAKNSRMVDTGLGLSNDGKVYVWGYMGSGAIGGPSSPLLGGVPPRAVLDLPAGIKQVSGMQYDVNALAPDGTVYGWGEFNTRNGTDAFRAWNTPRQIRIGTAWNGTGPLLTGATAISSTETAGAAILDSGRIYSWGALSYGGSSTDGAQPVAGLPDPTVAGNRPVYIKGAYRNFFVILENGDVYAWGGDSSTPSGYTSSATAKKVTALSSWFKSAVAPGQPYIVAVDGGINMGGAVLSDGTFLSWGSVASRVGARSGVPMTPALVPQLTGIVSMQFGFTGVIMAKSDGSLWGYGASDDYGQLAQTPAKVDDNVRQFASGQGYYIWQRADGSFRGRGYNPQGAIGTPIGTITTNRPVSWDLSALVQ
ncbi:alpha-tubulin suppressor-like RCC1 family protein [Microbacterium sp. AG790]|uniref:RCC1 domain-containing protein n=1 Tax=Microbacterium sp. AG790 TaxID=2183995 RepID=UPI000EB4A034|nr:hypothetical protein [Microbacterium sp. AG790]RKS90177.1 alpha-tubulin suppressor-like RCC1 family protein [Microbacterium sp. AG790]